MFSILVPVELAKALLAFRSKDKDCAVLQGCSIRQDKSLVTTDGKRLIRIPIDLYNIGQAAPGTYEIKSKARFSAAYTEIIIAPVDVQYPDIEIVTNNGWEKVDVVGGDTGGGLGYWPLMFKAFKVTDIPINPDFLRDLPPGEFMDVWKGKSGFKFQDTKKTDYIFMGFSL